MLGLRRNSINKCCSMSHHAAVRRCANLRAFSGERHSTGEGLEPHVTAGRARVLHDRALGATVGAARQKSKQPARSQAAGPLKE
jgi:hypothetical protein